LCSNGESIWNLKKSIDACVDQAPMITLACCTLHYFCQLQSMLEPMVRDVQTWGDPFVDFTCMCILIP
jgi:hypothetical protein